MTDSEFLSFIRSCTLSNEDIARGLGISLVDAQRMRRGDLEAHSLDRDTIIRVLSMMEHALLREQINNYHDRRFPK